MNVVKQDPEAVALYSLKGNEDDIRWVLSMYAIPHEKKQGVYYISETEYNKHMQEFARKGVVS